jgi:hypothetical protein
VTGVDQCNDQHRTQVVDDGQRRQEDPEPARRVERDEIPLRSISSFGKMYRRDQS